MAARQQPRHDGAHHLGLADQPAPDLVQQPGQVGAKRVDGARRLVGAGSRRSGHCRPPAAAERGRIEIEVAPDHVLLAGRHGAGAQRLLDGGAVIGIDVRVRAAGESPPRRAVDDLRAAGARAVGRRHARIPAGRAGGALASGQRRAAVLVADAAAGSALLVVRGACRRLGSVAVAARRPVPRRLPGARRLRDDPRPRRRPTSPRRACRFPPARPVRRPPPEQRRGPPRSRRSAGRRARCDREAAAWRAPGRAAPVRRRPCV